MKFSKSIVSLLASATMLTLRVGPMVQLAQTQTAQASSNYDIPVGTVTQATGTIRVCNDYQEPIVHLYNFNGDTPKINTVRNLKNGSKWYTDEYKTAPNENDVITRYYRVSTNEWVMGRDVDTLTWDYDA